MPATSRLVPATRQFQTPELTSTEGVQLACIPPTLSLSVIFKTAVVTYDENLKI
jgi:hypothetical protein